MYFPELFGARVRASAMAVTNSAGRLLIASGPLVAGTIATSYFGGDLGVAVTVVASLLVIGAIGVALTPETRGLTLEVAARADPPLHPGLAARALPTTTD